MKKPQRTDVHRPGAIIPADYTYELSFWYGIAECPEGYGLEDLAILVEKFPRFRDVDHKCDVCGSRFAYGGAFVHKPTGQTILVGVDCAQKYAMLIDFAGFDAVREMGKRATAAALTRRRNQHQREAFLAANDGLREALACGHRITNDLSEKLTKYHSLSPAQMNLAFKLHAETFCPARPSEINIPAPEGRVTVRGIIVKTATHVSDFGETWKMTVKVTTDAGTWLCWGTAPGSLLDDACRAGIASKGLEIEFTATLKRGRDAHFALFKRPTNCKIVGGLPEQEHRNVGALRELAKVEDKVDPAVYAAAKSALEDEMVPRPGTAGNVVAKLNADMGLRTRGYA